MELRHSFDVLAEVIASYESGGGSIRAVETTTDGTGAVAATLDVAVDRCGQGSGPSPAAATISPEGELTVEYSPAAVATVVPTGDDDRVTETDREATVTDDGDLVLSLDLRIEAAGAGGPAAAGGPAETNGPAAAASGGDEGVATGDGTGEAQADEPGGERESRAGGGDVGKSESESPAAALAAVRDDSVPPFEDVAYLRRLYETCETFAEMSRHIEMDVSAETVRRYMTEAGVHQPATYETDDGGRGTDAPADDDTESEGAGDAGPSEAREPAGGVPAEGAPPAGAGSRAGGEGPTELPPDDHLVADGLGLPADLELRDVVDAVVDARCLYDVTRSLDLDQDRTRELLVQLNLLDLVSHRLSTVREQDTSFEDVAARIRQCSPEAT